MAYQVVGTSAALRSDSVPDLGKNSPYFRIRAERSAAACGRVPTAWAKRASEALPRPSGAPQSRPAGVRDIEGEHSRHARLPTCRKNGIA